MPIVNSVTEFSTNTDGSRHVVVRNYDQDGLEYMYSFLAPVGFDIDAAVVQKTAQLDVSLAEAEFEQIVGEVE